MITTATATRTATTADNAQAARKGIDIATTARWAIRHWEAVRARNLQLGDSGTTREADARYTAEANALEDAAASILEAVRAVNGTTRPGAKVAGVQSGRFLYIVADGRAVPYLPPGYADREWKTIIKIPVGSIAGL